MFIKGKIHATKKERVVNHRKNTIIKPSRARDLRNIYKKSSFYLKAWSYHWTPELGQNIEAGNVNTTYQKLQGEDVTHLADQNKATKPWKKVGFWGRKISTEDQNLNTKSQTPATMTICYWLSPIHSHSTHAPIPSLSSLTAICMLLALPRQKNKKLPQCTQEKRENWSPKERNREKTPRPLWPCDGVRTLAL